MLYGVRFLFPPFEPRLTTSETRHSGARQATLGALAVMIHKQSHRSPDRAPQIVPNGYWTFWCVLSLLGGIAGIVTTVTSEMEHDGIIGVLSFAWSIAWAVVYWRIRRETKAT